MLPLQHPTYMYLVDSSFSWIGILGHCTAVHAIGSDFTSMDTKHHCVLTAVIGYATYCGAYRCNFIET